MEIENGMDEFGKCFVQQSNGKRFEFRTTQLSNTGLRRQSNKQRHKKILCGRPLMTWPPMMININSHRAGLNRGVPMCRSTQIMGGSFRRGLTSELVTFSTARAVPPSLLYKSNGWKSKMAASHFCILPSDWPERLYFSIQVQLYGLIPLLCMNRGHQWTLLHYYYLKTAKFKCGNLE